MTMVPSLFWRSTAWSFSLGFAVQLSWISSAAARLADCTWNWKSQFHGDPSETGWIKSAERLDDLLATILQHSSLAHQTADRAAMYFEQLGDFSLGPARIETNSLSHKSTITLAGNPSGVALIQLIRTSSGSSGCRRAKRRKSSLMALQYGLKSSSAARLYQRPNWSTIDGGIRCQFSLIQVPITAGSLILVRLKSSSGWFASLFGGEYSSIS